MSNFTDETMLIIKTIKEFVKKNPNSEAVENYYLSHVRSTVSLSI